MANKVICIGRQFGSGGHEVAVKVGEQLGIKVYEKDLFHMACKYGELSEKEMESADEAATNPYLFKTVHEGNSHVMRGMPTSRVLFDLQSHEIKRIARQEDCVFVGRCADFVLQDEKISILKVFLYAPLEFRVQRKMTQERLPRNKAVKIVNRMDKQRERYYTFYTGQKWGDPDYYDIYIDTAQAGVDKAVQDIVMRYALL